MVVEVQPRSRFGYGDPGPVGAGGVHDQQVVPLGELAQGFARDQPPQVAGDLFGVAEDRRDA